jgi:hypothetical protein
MCWPRIPKGYIRCTSDRMLDQDAQRRDANQHQGTIEVLPRISNVDGGYNLYRIALSRRGELQ